jgi:hypothetical protein
MKTDGAVPKMLESVEVPPTARLPILSTSSTAILVIPALEPRKAGNLLCEQSYCYALAVSM